MPRAGHASGAVPVDEPSRVPERARALPQAGAASQKCRISDARAGRPRLCPPELGAQRRGARRHGGDPRRHRRRLGARGRDGLPPLGRYRVNGPLQTDGGGDARVQIRSLSTTATSPGHEVRPVAIRLLGASPPVTAPAENSDTPACG